MYCISRVPVVLMSKCRPTSRIVGSLKLIPIGLPNHAKVPSLLSNQSPHFSSTSKTFMQVKRKGKPSSVKLYKMNQKVKLIDSDNNVICETTYVKARIQALNENMKLFDMESDPKSTIPKSKVVEFKYVTGKEYFEMSMAAKKENKETKEATDNLRMKTIRLNSYIMDNDFDNKMKTALDGINKGHAIKVCIRHKKGIGPDEREMKESELLEKISQKLIGEGKITQSKERGIFCYIHPIDSEPS